MEWLLVMYFNGIHDSISTERLTTYTECKRVGEIIKKDSGLLTVFNYDCIEIKKLESK